MGLPGRVADAMALAERLRFASSCTPGTGRMLAALAAAATGTLAESGTGCGVGTAWLRTGLRTGGRLITVERDPRRFAAVRGLFADDPAVTVLYDDWRALAAYAPFALLFLDGGGKPAGPRAVVDLMAPGGIVVLDDFTPCDGWPPTYRGEVDALRIAWLADPRFLVVEVRTAPDQAALLAARR